MQSIIKFSFYLIFLFALAACGGGGSASSTTDNDVDNDGIDDIEDNCSTFNPDEADTDGDG